MKRSTSILGVTAAVLLGAVIAHASVSVGQSAPDFKVKDTSGKEQSLSAYKGKFVVLEWTNPGCPFVQKHYDTANMPSTQKAAEAKGVVWLTVSSTAKDAGDYKQPSELAAWLKEKGAAPTAVLMDDDGKIGHAYGARTTPHSSRSSRAPVTRRTSSPGSEAPPGNTYALAMKPERAGRLTR
jgi:peroxiredoxin